MSLPGVPPDQLAMAQMVGQKYGVDPLMLLAIAKHETGYGTLGAGREGYTLGWLDQNSLGPQAQYEATARKLGRLGQGSPASIPDIQQWYAPVGAGNDPTGLNQNWISGVQAAYQDLANQVSAGGGTPLAPEEPKTKEEDSSSSEESPSPSP